MGSTPPPPLSHRIQLCFHSLKSPKQSASPVGNSCTFSQRQMRGLGSHSLLHQIVYEPLASSHIQYFPDWLGRRQFSFSCYSSGIVSLVPQELITLPSSCLTFLSMFRVSCVSLTAPHGERSILPTSQKEN